MLNMTPCCEPLFCTAVVGITHGRRARPDTLARCTQILEEQQALLAEASQSRENPRCAPDGSSRAWALPPQGPDIAAEAGRGQPAAEAGTGRYRQQPVRFVYTIRASPSHICWTVPWRGHAVVASSEELLAVSDLSQS